MEFPWFIGSQFMPREERNNKPPHMYAILGDFLKVPSHMQFYSSLNHWEPAIIFTKGVKNSGYRAQILSLPLSSCGNGNLLGLFMYYFLSAEIW